MTMISEKIIRTASCMTVVYNDIHTCEQFLESTADQAFYSAFHTSFNLTKAIFFSVTYFCFSCSAFSAKARVWLGRLSLK